MGTAAMGRRTRDQPGLFFSLPLGMTAVIGATGRSETEDDSLELPLSFLGFILALSLRCSPFGILNSSSKASDVIRSSPRSAAIGAHSTTASDEDESTDA
ncbi:hypothetical protein Ddc_21576 [Ditylenchus destructor]|nr:hypothetical protein Ddc_21576 [Ditylenchus destructor]